MNVDIAVDCQRFLLRDSGVRVLEVAPPWVHAELMNEPEGRAGNAFLTSSCRKLWTRFETDADEILVEAAKPLRANPGPKEPALVNGFNQPMLNRFTSRQA